jgi:pimeloyl-ACP methyl ester carboxylesterase
MRWYLAALVVLGLGLRAHAATPTAVIADPPADKAHPAAMAYVSIPSHGARMNGVFYTAAGVGPHPALLLLHGFPGNEQNLDLAQAVRRAGFDVLTLHYRGSWGSSGAFSFAHAIEDADAAVAFLRDPATAAKFHINPKQIFVAGHSMGGFMAASAAAHDPAIAGVVMISAWNIGADGGKLRDPVYRKAQLKDEFGDDAIPLAGTSPDRLIDEIIANAGRWEFASYVPALDLRPMLLVTADDGSLADSHRLALALRQNNNRAVTEIHMATDHPYSDHRIALEAAVVDWLEHRRTRP